MTKGKPRARPSNTQPGAIIHTYTWNTTRGAQGWTDKILCTTTTELHALQLRDEKEGVLFQTIQLPTPPQPFPKYFSEIFALAEEDFRAWHIITPCHHHRHQRQQQLHYPPTIKIIMAPACHRLSTVRTLFLRRTLDPSGVSDSTRGPCQ